jgi:D-proline reductase (dithiol) PrdB
MSVDDYKYLPRSFASMFQVREEERVDDVPFTPLAKPPKQARIALVTTGGIWNKETDPPFDYEREKREPLWGDPSFRVIRRDVTQEQIGAGHLHLNNDDVLQDFNIALPISRFIELEEAGEIGSLAEKHYSFMGFQGGGPAGPNTDEWRDRYGPEAARQMLDEGVDAVVVAPT